MISTMQYAIKKMSQEQAQDNSQIKLSCTFVKEMPHSLKEAKVIDHLLENGSRVLMSNSAILTLSAM